MSTSPNEFSTLLVVLRPFSYTNTISFSFSSHFLCLSIFSFFTLSIITMDIQFFSTNMFPFILFFRNFLSYLFIFVFGAIIRLIFRIQADHGTTKLEIQNKIDGDHEKSIEISSGFSQKFDKEPEQESENCVSVSLSPSNSNKYEFKFNPSLEIHGFIQQSQSESESETLNCVVEEFHVSASPSSDNQKQYFWDFLSEQETEDETKTEEFIEEKQNEYSKPSEEVDDVILEEGEILASENKIMDGLESSFPEVQILGDDYSFSDSDSTSSDGPISSEVFDHIDDSKEMELESLVAIEDEKEEIYISEEEEDDEEFIEFEFNRPVSNVSYAKVSPINGSPDHEFEMENEDNCGRSDENEWQEKELKFEEEDEDEDEDESEFSKEHRDLIEQLKLELRNARTGGLPTILEDEEEVPESDLVQSLKRLEVKTHGNFQYKQQLIEIHKVYKIYAEKMRKLDVLNSQTMHAIGFLKLKDPVSPIAGRKSPIGTVKSLLSHNLWSSKAHRVSAETSPRFIKDLNIDLELVYVGHLCLSWELLYWQHRKATQLQDNDSQGTHQYNQVVNKFQLFCVLVQRFVEDEQFCGPRIQNYVKNRYVIRSLLQVPAIREDGSNDKRVRSREGENTISIIALVQIIEDSMRVFWEFLRTDKDVANSTIKGTKQLHQTQLHSPADVQLMMMEIRADLQKKEKRLKEIMRSGNCIVKKFQRQRNGEGRMNNALLIAEVELKLVSRVLSMSKLNENQLIWCHKKLNQINFVNRKVVIEPSFLLFPC